MGSGPTEKNKTNVHHKYIFFLYNCKIPGKIFHNNNIKGMLICIKLVDYQKSINLVRKKRALVKENKTQERKT